MSDQTFNPNFSEALQNAQEVKSQQPAQGIGTPITGQLQDQAAIVFSQLEQLVPGQPILPAGVNTYGTIQAGQALDGNAIQNAQVVPTQQTRPQLPKDDDFLIVPNPNGPGLVIENTGLNKPEAPKPSALGPEFENTLQSYMAEMDEEIEKNKELKEKIEAEKAAKDEEDEEKDPEEAEAEFNEKYKEAVVIIDKMGLGTTINFTDEERAKLEQVRKIRLEEIETVDLKTIKKKKAKKNSLDNILKRQKSLHSTPVVLPASGYTAVMKGCSTYELISLMGGSQNALIDTETKWSLVHSKLESTSLGNMDFNTFLSSTAATDYSMFIYGLLCATYPDDDKIPLKCQNPKCGKEHDHHYSVQSLIRVEGMSEKLKTVIADIVDNSHTEETAKQYHNNAPVQQTKVIQLPISGIIMDLYIQSAHELIYKSIQSLSQNEEEKYTQAALLSTVVKEALLVDPDDENGDRLSYDDPMDITKIIYTLSDTDVITLSKQSEILMDDLDVEFGLMNVKCPHCNHYRETIPFDIETILFYRYQQAMSTRAE